MKRWSKSIRIFWCPACCGRSCASSLKLIELDHEPREFPLWIPSSARRDIDALILGIASFKLRHIDVADGKIDHNAREVRTKFSKSFVTIFFPVGNDIQTIVADWVDYLRSEKLWGLDDPLLPATKVAVGDDLRFWAVGLDRKHWSSASPIRSIFKVAFAAAGLPYFSPHSFRKTLALLGGELCQTPEQYKAWSQNLGHEHVLTTYSSYGSVSDHRQAEIIRSMA